MKKIFVSLSIVCLVLFGAIALPKNVFAQDGGAGAGTQDGGAGAGSGEKSGLQITLINPLKADDLEGFISSVVGILLKFLIPILAILFIYNGFQLVTSRGNKDALDKAKKNFFNLVIGAVLILGAWTFGNVIMNTLKEVGILN